MKKNPEIERIALAGALSFIFSNWTDWTDDPEKFFKWYKDPLIYIGPTPDIQPIFLTVTHEGRIALIERFAKLFMGMFANVVMIAKDDIIAEVISDGSIQAIIDEGLQRARGKRIYDN